MNTPTPASAPMTEEELGAVRARHEWLRLALPSAVKFLLSRYERLRCDSPAVADCVRCQTVAATRWLDEAHGDRAKLIAQVSHLKSELDRAREALRFYAAEGSWQDDIAPDPAGTPIPYTSPASGDYGQRARAALSPSDPSVGEKNG